MGGSLNSTNLVMVGDSVTQQVGGHNIFVVQRLLSQPVQLARWALMRHFLSVCASRLQLITRRVIS